MQFSSVVDCFGEAACSAINLYEHQEEFHLFHRWSAVLLMSLGKQQNMVRFLSPATPVGNLKETLGAFLWYCQDLVIVAIWEVSQQTDFPLTVSPSLSLSFKLINK